MHNAPAVSFPVGRSRFQAGFLSGLWLAGAAVCIYWASVMDAVGWRHALAGAMPVAAGAAAWLSWRHRAGGCLRWDGQCWWLDVAAEGQPAAASASAPGVRSGGTGAATVAGIETGVSALSLHLDLQGFLLLKLRLADGTVRWLWLDRGADLAQWQALRRAIHANVENAASPRVADPKPLHKASA